MGGSGSKNYFSGSNKPTEPRPPSKPANPKKSSGGGGSGGASVGSDACNIIATGTLRSPIAAVVATLAVDDELEVHAVPIGEVEVLQAVADAGDPAGVIDTPEEQQILDCIAGGHQYKATVTRRAGGAVAVLITRV